jgi:hypothetical protein
MKKYMGLALTDGTDNHPLNLIKIAKNNIRSQLSYLAGAINHKFSFLKDSKVSNYSIKIILSRLLLQPFSTS